MKQLSDFDKWKASVSYGHRWIAESTFILGYQENVWRVRQGQALSEHGKGDVLESVAVQHVCRNEILG